MVSDQPISALRDHTDGRGERLVALAYALADHHDVALYARRDDPSVPEHRWLTRARTVNRRRGESRAANRQTMTWHPAAGDLISRRRGVYPAEDDLPTPGPIYPGARA